jgi:hypothetical protein
VTPTGENCTVRVNTIIEGEEYEIGITVHPPFQFDQVRETLVIETNIEGKERIEIPYHYYGVSDIEVYPKEILLYKEHMQPGMSRIITVKNHLEGAVSIINPQVHGNHIDYKIEEIEPGIQVQIFIIFNEGFTFPEKGDYSFSFIVKHDSENRSFTIPIVNGEAW